jgi:hypothetical protein
MVIISRFVAFALLFAAPAAQAETAMFTPLTPTTYNYANDEAEYSLVLPEAPTVATIWEESVETKAYLENPPDDGAALGEIATFKRVDIDTEEVFDVKITFLKARPFFLRALKEKKIKKMLENQYRDVPLTNKEFTFSPGAETLKWAALSGFTLDAHKHPLFSATHYLTGRQSIQVVQVTYSIENKAFDDYYKALVDSITYSPP